MLTNDTKLSILFINCLMLSNLNDHILILLKKRELYAAHAKNKIFILSYEKICHI